MKQVIFLAGIVLLTWVQVLAQCVSIHGGLKIMEVGNPDSRSNAEYIELLALPDSENPTASLDLRGWIIDDNNADETEVGNAPGHIRLGECFSSVPPGTIILLYNDQEIPSGIHPSWDGMGTVDGLWQFPVYSSCFIGYSGSPSPSNAAYETKIQSAPSWDMIELRNWGDGVQLRSPSGQVMDAMHWAVDNFPAGGQFILGKERPYSAVGKTYSRSGANFTADLSPTPGAPNTDEEASIIDQYRSVAHAPFHVYVSENTPALEESGSGILDLMIEEGQGPFQAVVRVITGPLFEQTFELPNNGQYTLTGIPAGDLVVNFSDRSGCKVVFFVTLSSFHPTTRSGESCLACSSDDSNFLNSWEDLDYQTYKTIATENGVWKEIQDDPRWTDPNIRYNQFKCRLGRIMEVSIAKLIQYPSNRIDLPICDDDATGRVRPDFLGDSGYTEFLEKEKMLCKYSYPKGFFIEVKTSEANGTIANSVHNINQIHKFIDLLSQEDNAIKALINPYKLSKKEWEVKDRPSARGVASLYIITLANSKIDDQFIKNANEKKVRLFHGVVQYANFGVPENNKYYAVRVRYNGELTNWFQVPPLIRLGDTQKGYGIGFHIDPSISDFGLFRKNGTENCAFILWKQP